MSRWLIFDLDGTLVDSVPDLTAALNRLALARGLAPYSEAEVTPMVGDGAGALVQRALAARDVVAVAEDLQALLRDYTAHAADLSVAYPGVADTLAALHQAGWIMAVCTNKPEGAAHALLAALGLDRWFVTVGGGDTFPVRKPDPAHLLATLAAAGGTPDRAVMVGDHHNDIEAARAAGVKSVFCRWGYGRDVPGASAEAASFDELPGIAAGLMAPPARPATASAGLPS